MQKILAVAALVLAAGTLAGCSSEQSSGPVEGTTRATTASTPTPTPTPTAEAGSRKSPFPQGTPGQYESTSMWTVTFTSTDSDAWPEVQASNQYNEAPPTGYSDVIGNLTVEAGEIPDDGGADPGVSLDVEFVGSDGNAYDTINHPCGVTPSPELQDAGTMYSGASRTTIVCAQVPTSAITGGTWSVTYMDGGSPTAFFASA